MWSTAFTRSLGDNGVLKPGRLRWLRALGWMVLLFAVVTAGAGLGGLVLRPLGIPGPARAAITAMIAVALYVGTVRLGERRWPGEFAPRQAWELPAGFVIGATIFAVVMGVLVGLDHYAVRDVADGSPTGMIEIAIVSGVVEEVLLRAIVFRLLSRAFNVWWALGLSAALFGALHLGNPNATVFSALAIALEAGVLLAAFYLWTGRVWASIGAHAAWNFTQGYIFGAPVSGYEGGAGLLESTPDAGDPMLLTGGAFGPEASLAALVIATGAGAAIVWHARRRAVRPAEPAQP